MDANLRQASGTPHEPHPDYVPPPARKGAGLSSRLAKGALAGAVAGAAGAWVMERAMNAAMGPPPVDPTAPEQPMTQDPKLRVANAVLERTTGRPVPPGRERAAQEAVHYAMGAVSGALYGAAVEAAPRLKAGWGLPFGAAVFLAAPEAALPALGLAPPPTQQPLKQQAMGLGMHLLYGAATETVRRPLRAAMGS